MLYLCNAFSINMLPEHKPVNVHFIPLTLDEARRALEHGEFVNAIGHVDTAHVVGNMLGIPLEANRVSIAVHPGDRLIVAQYSGPRLPEGATELPEDAEIRFWLVYMEDER